MSNNEDNKRVVIPVDHIRETKMPPYEYQKPQNGFGSASSNQRYAPDKKPDPEVKGK